MKPSPKATLSRLAVVRPKRLYEQIAEQVEALIRDGSFARGTRLPAERELAEQLGVSRPSIREALIALEAAGLIETRVGDGTYVRENSGAKPVFPLETSKDMGPGTLEQFEARRAIECTIAEMAARRATPADVEDLRDCVARMRKLIVANKSPSGEHLYFHTRLAEIGGNSILAGAIKELWRLRQGEMWDLLRRHVETDESYRLGLEFRERLMVALAAHDGPKARKEMQRHFDRIARLYFDTKI
ncbi:MAG: FadR family transcriptional regulator [Alphaproteobacteria bacterium]|nr:FadR family transcriptional regulator [Alphaproteobacteria bacterium]MCA0450171.1 FadR family transcriptional regulator [Pseudomonadota bacterium]